MSRPASTGGRAISLVVLGDSIAFGQGATRPEDTIGARLATALADAGISTDVFVRATPGARSAALASQVRAASAASPDVALIVIGANDVTHLVPVPEAAAHLADAVRALHARQVQVVVAPTPDLSSVPWLPLQFRELARSVSTALREAQTRAAVRAGARVVVVDDALHHAFVADPGLFSADRFHPSSEGYALITQALLPAVLAAAQEVVRRRRDPA